MEMNNNEISINNNNNDTNIKTKVILFKGKEKVIPEHNPDNSKCEYYLISKFRYCHFTKYKQSNYCIYHMEPNSEDFQICPYDPKHRIKQSNFKQHLKTCNTLLNQNEIQTKPWYKKNINYPTQINNFLSNTQTLSQLSSFKWDDIPQDEFESIILKIINSYNKIKDMYKTYVFTNHIEQILHNMNVKYSLSGMNIDEDNNINKTNNIIHSTKHNIQNEEISSVCFKSGLIDTNYNYIVIEFGAGKGGLSKIVNSHFTESHCCMNILLERQSMRYKKEVNVENMLRYRTDIIDFDINFLNDFDSINIKHTIKEQMKMNHKIVGIAKHICGCGFDLSLKCLFNYKKFDSDVKGICMATCCHHLNRIDTLNNGEFYLNELGMTGKEIVGLFKATSWMIGEGKGYMNENDGNIKKGKEEIFEKMNVSRKQIGQMAKYVIDLVRCMLLIEKGFKVFYLKYCDKGITVENNLILAIK